MCWPDHYPLVAVEKPTFSVKPLSPYIFSQYVFIIQKHIHFLRSNIFNLFRGISIEFDGLW